MTQKLDEEQIAEVHEVCNLIGPHLTQAIADGITLSHVGLIECYRTENEANRDNPLPTQRNEVFERELWSKVYAASVSNDPDRYSHYHLTVADIAVERFNERFPK